MQFIDYDWKAYSRLDKKQRSEQISHLIPCGYDYDLYDLEFTFVPLKEMQTISQEIDDLYNDIKIVDNTVQLEHEVYFTSKIEGADTTIQRTHELITQEDKPKNFSENMVIGAYNATKFLNLHPGKMSVDLILETWNILVEDACANSSIRGERFRTGNVQVGKHVGMHKDYIEGAIEKFVDYYESIDLNNYPYIKAAILHYIFEFIHPFCDGNGRLGRLLMLNYLINNDKEKFKAIAVSPAIDADRQSYDYNFNISENVYNDITPFIIYMLTVFRDSMKGLTETKDYEFLVQQFCRQNKICYGISKRLFKNDGYNNNDLEQFYEWLLEGNGFKID